MIHFSSLKLVAGIDETLKTELGLDAEITSNIQQIAKRLYDNVSMLFHVCMKLNSIRWRSCD